MPETNGDRARRGYEAAHRGDLDVVRDFLDPEVRWHGGDPDASGACGNRDETLAFMREARNRRALGQLVTVVDAGERVVVIMRPAGAEHESTALSANLTTFRDGRAVEMVHYPHPADALVAVGLPPELTRHGIDVGPA